MRKELLLVSGLLIGSMAFAIDPAEIDSLINLKGVVETSWMPANLKWQIFTRPVYVH